MFKYLTPKCEEGLRNYKYHGSDASFLSDKLNGFWEWCAKVTPKWVAPNLMTFVSFMFGTVGFLVFLYFYPDMEGESDLVIYVTVSILVFIYQTLDAVDGKHARNTKTSSPLGELFDHGLDAFVTMYTFTIVASMFQLGNSLRTFVFFATMYCNTYAAFFEEKFTFVLRFGKFNSVTEILCLIEIVLVLFGFVGNSYMKWNLMSLFGVTSFTLPLGGLLPYIGLIFASINVGMSYSIVMKKKRAGELAGKDSYLQIHKGLFPYLLPTIFYSIIVFSDVDFYHENHTLICLSYALMVSYAQARVVVARICKIDIQIIYPILYPVPFIALAFWFLGFGMELKWLVMIMLVNYQVLLILMFFFGFMYEIAYFLNIWVFSVKKRGN